MANLVKNRLNNPLDTNIGAEVYPFRIEGDDQALVKALQAGRPGAGTALYDRYAQHIQRVLARVLGMDPELKEVLHDVFVQALSSIDSLKEGQKLKGWLTSIAVFTARGCIRKRTRKRWLHFSAPEHIPEMTAPALNPETREALLCTYRVLEKLRPDDRIAFTLRYIEGMELKELADVCHVSLATIKRRLAHADHRFLAFARRQPALKEWVEQSERWRNR